MNFFDEAALRLKQQLKVNEDKFAAQALGLSSRAWSGRKKSGSFPEKELRALAQQSPELGLDVDYVLTGVPRALRVSSAVAAFALDDAAMQRMRQATAPDAGIRAGLAALAERDSAQARRAASVVGLDAEAQQLLAAYRASGLQGRAAIMLVAQAVAALGDEDHARAAMAPSRSEGAAP